MGTDERQVQILGEHESMTETFCHTEGLDRDTASDMAWELQFDEVLRKYHEIS